MGILGDVLKSSLRSEMKRRTQEILRAIRKSEKSQIELTKAIDRWIKFMDKLVKELKE